MLRRVVPDQQQFAIDELLRKQRPPMQGEGTGVPLGENSASGFLSPPRDATRTVAPALPPKSTGYDSGPPQVATATTDPLTTIPDRSNTGALGAPPMMVTRNDKGRPVAALGGADTIERNRALIEEQEGYHAPRSTKDQIMSLLTGGIPGALDYATNQHTRDRWATGEDIANEEGQINRELGLQQKQAGIEATKWRPVYQQGQQEERDVNNALSQYNRLETYDPEDPAQAGLKAYFDAHHLVLPAKDKYHRPVATWANGQLILTDETGTRRAQIDGENVTDVGRTPNAAGLTPNQQAGVTTRVGEGQKNRAARAANTDKVIAAIASRQDKQIAASIAALGDPQEMYGAASDLWAQAQEKESEANAIQPKPGYQLAASDTATKKQLLSQAQKLKEATVRIQQEARKAASAGRGHAKSADGKHHYTMAQIQATIDPKTGLTKSGKRLEEVLSALRGNKNVVIDE